MIIDKLALSEHVGKKIFATTKLSETKKTAENPMLWTKAGGRLSA